MSIKNFYIRRVLRILPLYYLIIIISLYVVPLIVQGEAIPLRTTTDKLDAWYYYSFLGNFDFFYNGITNVIIGVLWSVSVEEQFYLIAPFLIAFIPTKHLLKVIIGLILFAICYRLFLSGGKNVLIKFHTLSCMADLLMGSLLAVLCSKQSVVGQIQQWSRKLIVFVYAAGITLFLFRFKISMIETGQLIFKSFMPFLFSLFFAFIIAEQNFATRSFYKIGNIKWLSFLGRYTYGMYCYHMIMFAVAMTLACKFGLDVLHPDKYYLMGMTLVIFVLTTLVSIISYHLFEKKFLDLKSKFI